MSSKSAQGLLGPSQPNVRCSVSETKRWSKQEVQSRRRQNLVSQRTSWHNYTPQQDERDVKTSRYRATSYNQCLRATSVTMLSDHNCETRHIKSMTGHKSNQSVESYNERPSMKQQQKMSLVFSDFIENASSGSATSVQGKENDIQKQCRPIPEEFPHQEPGKAVFVENTISTSTASVSHGDQRSFPQYFNNCSVNVHNYYTSR